MASFIIGASTTSFDAPKDCPGGTDVSAVDGKSIVAFVRTLGRQPDDLLRFFDRKDYYMLHGRDADSVAVSYFKSSTCVKFWRQGDEKHAYLTINKNMASEVIRCALLEQRRRIEVYRLEGKGWMLERKGSPGNLQAFEEECTVNGELGLDTSTVIVAVRLGRTAGSKGYAGNARLVGLCFIDCSGRMIRTSEFEDDEHLSTLESIVCQQGARECLLPAEGLSDPDRKQIDGIMDVCEVSVSTAPKGAFGSKHTDQDLRRLLGVEELHNRCFESSQQLAVSACGGLIKYLDMMTNDESHGQWLIEWVEPRQFMRLDAGALRALSVEPLPGEPDKNASLMGIFAHCKTIGGSRTLRKWFKQPLLSRHDINTRLDLTQAFCSSFELRSMLRDEVLPSMACDVDRLSRKLFAAKGTLQDVVMLYQFVGGLPRVLQVLQSAESVSSLSDEQAALLRSEFADPLTGVHNDFSNFIKLVEAAVDLDAIARHEYLIQPHFNQELREINETKDLLIEQINDHHLKMQEELGLEQSLKLEQSQHGYVFRVSRKDEKELRSVSGLTTLQTKKEGVLFRDRVLTRLAGEYKEAAAEYDAAQAALVSKVVTTAATFYSVIREAQEILSKLDILLCFAQVSVSAPEPYVRPTILPLDEPHSIELIGCRHPCVERMDGVSFIKNDVRLVSGSSVLEIVTGPNMGGKSTYIRSIGVNVLLAQVGCFVPCDEARISPSDAVLARVGAGDMQSRGVSTFMAEMLETSSILKNASPSSLVIIDELGRGTSTYDGYGLAHAICSHLATTLGCPALFATHFHELTALASSHPTIRNKHVSAHVSAGELTMLFQVQDGPSDQSFGIHVAEASNFPPSVIASAKRKLAELEEPISIRKSSKTSSRLQEANDGVGSECDKDSNIGEVSQLLACLSDFAKLPLDKMGESEAMQQINSIQARLRDNTNVCGTAVVAADTDSAN
eukprot:CAMPEP_0119326074 /NCGR_PEP_ID=MMETSP1333-20130426/67397_1 /TAXON_ID=418940 /ORGANISM="Scyphosphaera apsteinii, Strain RCC1455" /LENGTH=957 /DNA_ID=CAMNT_0007334263 /DNA_START=94 /DNA_END=2967 /DNA_ORIENTATION=+